MASKEKGFIPNKEEAGTAMFYGGILGMVYAVAAASPGVLLFAAPTSYVGYKWRKGEGVLQMNR